jgi:hypothetical protein
VKKNQEYFITCKTYKTFKFWSIKLLYNCCYEKLTPNLVSKATQIYSFTLWRQNLELVFLGSCQGVGKLVPSGVSEGRTPFLANFGF